jgi:sulfatase modifying factor 1
LVDAARVGVTPGTFKVWVCAKKLEVKHTKAGVFAQDLVVKEKQVVSVRAVLLARAVSNSARGDLEWVQSTPAGIDFARTETTVAQYRACVDARKCSVPKDKDRHKACNWGYADRDAHPVNCVNWGQAHAFCRWAGGWRLNARLPTEEEWYAEASNRGTREYAWGNQEVTCDYAVWGDGSHTDGCRRDSTWPVCSKTAGNSVSGLCDMGGNVWEWTATSTGTAQAARDDATLLEFNNSLYTGTAQAVRGGSWYNDGPGRVRAVYRDTHSRADWGTNTGFRCARDRR